MPIVGRVYSGRWPRGHLHYFSYFSLLLWYWGTEYRYIFVCEDLYYYYNLYFKYNKNL